MMKILSPLVREEEVQPLAEAGADEFYCGLVNPGGALNDRPNNDRNSFGDVTHLQRAAKAARRSKKRIYLAVNSPALDLEAAAAQARTAERIGMDGLIVSNLLLIQRVRDMGLKLELNASCLGAVFNSQSIRFFQQLGVSTFHLPRQLGLEQLRMIRQELPDVRLSVFGMRGMCVNVEAFCLLHNLKEGYFVPCQHFRTLSVSGPGAATKAALNKKINMPAYSCALCALRQLDAMGIHSIKIEGRNASAKDKVRHVTMIKKALDSVRPGGNDDDHGVLCRRLFKRYFHEDCREEYCYY